jgi:hypothetical protein
VFGCVVVPAAGCGGTGDDAPCELAAGVPPRDVPSPLADFWVAGGARALSRQNRFQAPVDEDGYGVVYVENQRVCMWAYRTDDAAKDPEVFVRDRQASNAVWVLLGVGSTPFCPPRP